MKVENIAPGLWRWSTAHPRWTEAADWPREVGCVYYEAPTSVVLIDPLIPLDAQERKRFLSALDRDVERLDRPVAILLSVPWHARSSEELASRYGGTVGSPPSDVVALLFPEVEEMAYWLPEHATLVVGESLVGTSGTELALCPDTWVKGDARESLRSSLRSLLDLPAERILVGHGEPVLSDGRAALERALRA